MTMRGGKYFIPVLLAAGLGAAGVLWFYFGNPVVTTVERGLRSVEGLALGSVATEGSGRVHIDDVTYEVDGRRIFHSNRITVDLGSGLTPDALRMDAEITDLGPILQFLRQSLDSIEVGGEIRVDGELRPREDSPGIGFVLECSPRSSGLYDLTVAVDGRERVINGSYDPVQRAANLRIAGDFSPVLLYALTREFPHELNLSSPVRIEATAQLDFRQEDPMRALYGEMRFNADTVCSGGFWAFVPGERASFRRTADAWEIVLPQTTLLEPVPGPLGTITVSGGDSSEIRFSILNEPPTGEMTGIFRIDGRYDRDSGAWLFRQSESSDRMMRWSYTGPSGEIQCLWKTPRISGGGDRSRGSIDFSLGFDEMKFRPAGQPVELNVQPGSLAGAWRFDFDHPEGASFELTGTARTSRLAWPAPASAWSASSVQAAFRLDRMPGEAFGWNLIVEPEVNTVTLYGTELPKLKLEGLTGKLLTVLQPDSSEAQRWPEHISGELDLRRIQLVNSMFGAGEINDFRLNGSAGIAPSDGRILRLQASGSGASGVFRYPECEAVALEPAVRIDFDRFAVTPGDNFNVAVRARNWNVAALGGAIAMQEARGVWSGELREEGLLPPVWRIKLDAPGGRLSNRDLAGNFDALQFDGITTQNRMRGFRAEMTGLLAEWGRQDFHRSLRIEQQILTMPEPEGGESSLIRYQARGGAFRNTSDSGAEFAAEQFRIDLPLEWNDDELSGEGEFAIEALAVPGGLADRAAGTVSFREAALTFAGQADSGVLTEAGLKFQAALSWNRNWRLTGDYALAVAPLTRPVNLEDFLPAAKEMTLEGTVAATGTFDLVGDRFYWTTELRPREATIRGPQFELRRISGALRLPGRGSETGPAGGELRFGEFTAGEFTAGAGTLSLRFPSASECDILSAAANLWGGRARLGGPVTLREGMNPQEWNVIVRGLNISDLLRYLGFPAAVQAGKVDGTLFWSFPPGAAGPKLVSADLSGTNIGPIRMQGMEEFAVRDAESLSSRQRMALELLRDFDCRALRVQLEEENTGGYLLNLTASGKPMNAAQVRDDNYRRALRVIDSGALGLDGEIELFAEYLLPATQPERDSHAR